MKKHKLLSIILCGVIIGVTLVGCTSSKTQETTSSSTETAQQVEVAKPDFETKEYSKDGVSFSYPADWKIDESNASVILLMPTGENPSNMSISFLLQDAGEKLPPYSEYAEIMKPDLKAKFTNGNVTAEEYKEGANKGAKFIIEGLKSGQSLKMMQVHIFEGQKVAMFTYGGKREGYDSFIKQANYMISTFKLEK